VSELKELNAKVKAIEEMARIASCLRILENQKRTSDAIASAASQEDIPILGDPAPQPGLSSYRTSTIQP
jgi:hypothetical protein